MRPAEGDLNKRVNISLGSGHSLWAVRAIVSKHTIKKRTGKCKKNPANSRNSFITTTILIIIVITYFFRQVKNFSYHVLYIYIYCIFLIIV